MASILQINGKWRAQVRLRDGIRRTQTFDAQADAVEWAQRVEAAARQARRDRLLEVATQPLLAITELDPHKLQRFDLERFCGVYFLFLGPELVYIGQALNVPSRINEHFTKKGFDAWSWLPVPRAKLNEAEAYLIRKYRPRLNITYARSAGSNLPTTQPQPA